MKKFLTLCATFVFIGALLVGCIDNTVPDSVERLRDKKLQLIDAQIRLIDSQVKVNESLARLNDAYVKLNEAYAKFSEAQAELERAKIKIAEAQAKLIEAQARYQDALTANLGEQTEALKIQNEFEKGVLQAKIDAANAVYERQMWFAKAAMYRAMELAKINEEDYLAQLILMQWNLWELKIDALDAIFTKIRDLMLDRAIWTQDLIAWKARDMFYEMVNMPSIERELRHAIDLQELRVTHYKYMFDLWTDVKELAFEQYVAYADQMVPEMQKIKEKEKTLRNQIIAEEFELVKLEDAERVAQDKYFFSGVNTALTNVEKKNVFTSATATDIFRGPINVQTGFDANGVAVFKNVFTGVYKGTYNFYSPVVNILDQQGAVSHLGYLNTLEQLTNDLLWIERHRLFSGNGGTLSLDQLTYRESAKNTAVTNYNNTLRDWRIRYDSLMTRTNWINKRAAFNTEYTKYNTRYGDPSYADLSPIGLLTDVAKMATITDPMELMLYMVELSNKYGAIPGAMGYIQAIAEEDPNVKAGLIANLPVNFIYNMQKAIIEQYVNLVKTLLIGENTNDWKLAELEISDVLGGITFSPGALFDLVVGPGNAKTFKKIVDTALDLANAFDLITLLHAGMPGYYQNLKGFLGTANYGNGPLFDKYIVNDKYTFSTWEYHAWFLIYLLFEGTTVNIGNNILTINQIGYDNVTTKLWEDFLGCTGTNFPGRYTFNGLGSPAYAGTTATQITIGQRIAAINNLTFNPNIDRNLLAGASTVLARENALLSAWYTYFTRLGDATSTGATTLNGCERDLYNPYVRTWTVTNHQNPTAIPVGNNATPRWILETTSGAVAIPIPEGANAVLTVGALANTSAAPAGHIVYFNPLTATTLPSLVEGVDLYWTNFAQNGAIIPGPLQGYYPGLALKRTWLTGVQWNEIVYEGNPNLPAPWGNYQGDPILWQATEAWQFSTSYTAAPTRPSALNANNISLLPWVFLTERNYQQYNFWYEQQDGYKALITHIKAKIADLTLKVDELRTDWMDATAARVLKQYEIDALRNEADLAWVTWQAMEGLYNNLRNQVRFTYGTEYDNAYHAYINALERMEYHQANLEMWLTYYVYTDGGVDPDGALNIINDWRIIIAEQIKVCEEKLANIERDLGILEDQKAIILAIQINQ